MAAVFATMRTSALGFAHWWFSGRIVASQAGDPGSIPGQCTAVSLVTLELGFFQMKPNRNWLEGAPFECAAIGSLIIQSVRAFQRGFANLNPSKFTFNRALVVQW